MQSFDNLCIPKKINQLIYAANYDYSVRYDKKCIDFSFTCAYNNKKLL